jgi:hypothetical protein
MLFLFFLKKKGKEKKKGQVHESIDLFISTFLFLFWDDVSKPGLRRYAHFIWDSC